MFTSTLEKSPKSQDTLFVRRLVRMITLTSPPKVFTRQHSYQTRQVTNIHLVLGKE